MTPFDLKKILEDTLDEYIPFKECVYVNWCHYPNNGDHFIAAGSFKYLKDRHIGVKEIYSNACTQFNGEPIIAQGGGNLGDLFFNHEVFRRNLIQKNHASPIVIFPQSVFFQDPEKAKASSDIYNQHPDLTIFLREERSYEIAQNYFENCKLILCPDAAWYLADIVRGMQHGQLEKSDSLARNDEYLSLDHVGKPWNDWAFHDWTNYFKGKAMFSVAITYNSMFQLARCEHLVTDRLHGHIMACMMGIPNELLPVNYHKNKSTFETWTKHLPNTHFRLAGVNDSNSSGVKF